MSFFSTMVMTRLSLFYDIIFKLSYALHRVFAFICVFPSLYLSFLCVHANFTTSLNTAGSSIDGVWSNTCTQCGNGRGYILDTSHQSQVCDCQRGSLVVPDPHLDEPRPSSRPSTAMLRLTMVTTPSPPSQGRSVTPRRLSHPNLGVALGVASNPLQTTMFINNDKVFELSSNQNDPLPKAINFISDSVGQLVTLNDSADLSGVARPGRLGFSQSRTRPNVNRQRRENLAFMKANGELRSPGPMPAVLTNARR